MAGYDGYSYLMGKDNPNNNGKDYTPAQVTNSPTSGGGGVNGAWGLLGQGIQDTINIGFGIWDRWNASKLNKQQQENWQAQMDLAREQFEYAKYANENAAQIHSKDMSAAGLSPFAEGGAEGNFSAVGQPSGTTPTQANTGLKLELGKLIMEQQLAKEQMQNQYRIAKMQAQIQSRTQIDVAGINGLTSRDVAGINKEAAKYSADQSLWGVTASNNSREIISADEVAQRRDAEANRHAEQEALYTLAVRKQHFEEIMRMVQENNEMQKAANNLMLEYQKLKTETNEQNRNRIFATINNTLNHLWDLIPNWSKGNMTRDQFGNIMFEKYGTN